MSNPFISICLALVASGFIWLFGVTYKNWRNTTRNPLIILELEDEIERTERNLARPLPPAPTDHSHPENSHEG